MAHHGAPDAKIQSWMNEYVEMQDNLPKILSSGDKLGDGIILLIVRLVVMMLQLFLAKLIKQALLLY